MRTFIVIVAAFLVPFAAWGLLRNSAAAEPEALWAPLPGVVSVPPPDPQDSKEICAHAVALKARFNPASVRTAIFGYVVEADGTVDNITVVGTSGSRALDEAIIACVGTLRFQPAKSGHAMMVQWK